MTKRTADYLTGLVHELRRLPAETEWVEFKRNYDDPIEVGEYISALSNAAALADRNCGYMVWGVEDGSHSLVGTTFNPTLTKKGNENLLNWLIRLLNPAVEFRFDEVVVEGKRLVLLEISRAALQPVRFQGEEFIRIGSYKKKLKDFPAKERLLWQTLDTTPFESIAAINNVSADEVLRLIDYPAFFKLLNVPLPSAKEGILTGLAADRLISFTDAGGWDITNLGALLFAQRLADFPSLERKAMRVIVYKGANKVETVREQLGTKGYASGFEGLITYVNGLLPSNEALGSALRRTVPMYPEMAVRELVANALIHQDLFVTGAGPMVEIYGDRMEISNPGRPLMDPERFLDMQPRSRNERLASLMRRLGICEERGSGVDKVVFQLELYQLPPALFEVRGDSTIAVLFAQKPLRKMDKEERVRACYQHACLKYVMREYMTNTSTRERFGIEERNTAQASRMIKEAVETGRILPYDKEAAPKLMKYVPYWAG